ncbi:MAG: hypothetical protein QG622_3209 [Actinomycetota bacterium]|nr:hypothetical protein [Actinomycetota bacterium]
MRTGSQARAPGCRSIDVLRVVSLCSLVAAVLVTGRWALHRQDTLGRPRDFPAIAVTLALLVAAGAGFPALRHARFEHRLSEVASALAGWEVSVRCQTMSQAWTEAHSEAGYVRFGADDRPEPLATITLETCESLRSWVGSDHTAPDRAEVIAVHVLTHESMHLAGIRDESVAECAAVQRDARTAVLLGADPARGRALATAYWTQVYPLMPTDYRSGDCGPRLRLDEKLDDAPWTAVSLANFPIFAARNTSRTGALRLASRTARRSRRRQLSEGDHGAGRTDPTARAGR